MEECKHDFVGIASEPRHGEVIGNIDTIMSFVKWHLEETYPYFGHPDYSLDLYSDEDIEEKYTFDWFLKNDKLKYLLFEYCPHCGKKLNVEEMNNEIYRRANEIILKYKPKSMEDYEERKIQIRVQIEIEHWKWKESRRKPPVNGYVYVLKMKDIYKIGMTQDPKRRVKELIKLPYDLEMTICEYIKNYSIMEEKLHEHFKDKRLNGEWFNLNEQDLEYIKSELEKNRVLQEKQD